MQTQPYKVALVTRGAGAYSFTYQGPAGLAAGQLALVLLRGRPEIGVLGGEDEAPAGVKLQYLLPLDCPLCPAFGATLLQLMEASACAADEAAPWMTFGPLRTGCKVVVEPGSTWESSTGKSLAALARHCGTYTLAALKSLGAAEIKMLAEAFDAGQLGASLSLPGDPGRHRSPTGWNRSFALIDQEAVLHGLGPGTYSGEFLEGLPGGIPEGLPAASPGPATVPLHQPCKRTLKWSDIVLPAEWSCTRRWPQLAHLRICSAQPTWEELRSAGGLVDELAKSVSRGLNVLVVAPQHWMLDRLWPALALLQRSCLRYRPEGGPPAAAHILRRLGTSGPCLVLGGPAAARTALYFKFDRIILLDPSHPQFEPERSPHIDTRIALLLAATGTENTPREGPRIDLVELGRSLIPGASAHRLRILPLAKDAAPGGSDAGADVDPLPLQLRQPGLRRLIYFNRLGYRRGIHCIECETAVACPSCRSQRIRYSVRERLYICGKCGWSAANLRCSRCGLQTFSTSLPGLEAVALRPGDYVMTGPEETPPTTAQASVLGTSVLLEPLPGFWPEQVIYVHAEGNLGLYSDWPAAVDAAARLASLYANPDLQETWIVSDRLHDMFGTSLSKSRQADAWSEELGLRALAGLPPVSPLYRIRMQSQVAKVATQVREAFGRELQAHGGTTLLRLGLPFSERGLFVVVGYMANSRISNEELQILRWKAERQGAAVTYRAYTGPWT